MGDHEGWAQPSGLLPNGLLPNEEGCLTRELDRERWSIAEERTEELIARIQPNSPSEELRNAVAKYVQRLIMKCFACQLNSPCEPQVFTFGSVPLKTYLPDGDIDLTAFSKNQNLKDTWANDVRIMLENEEKSVNAEFRVKEVQYIQAEVKLIKCLVENIVVDISFNQLGGLCTLCFLEEVDQLIGQNHLFKRSIILIKAWCYYESRILGAHHGLISTYALETLVLYIFHVFNNSLAGPLEVLYRFLEFFGNFDWENFCVSLWGPVPVRSLPDMTAVSPRRDGGELLLSKLFLDSCSTVYAVFQGGQENHGQPFVSKHFNVVDPLRTNNNLGRSVSKGNFYRIRSAFGYGAKRLARLLNCPKEDIITEFNQFFMNAWERHGSGQRPDAPTDCLLRLRRLNSEHLNRPENPKNKSSSKKKNESLTIQDSENDRNHSFQAIPYQHRNEDMPRTSHTASVSHRQNQNSSGYRTSPREPDQVALNDSSSQSVHNQKGQGVSKPDYLANDTKERFQFVRTRSSPDLLNTSVEISSRGRHNRVPNTGQNHSDSVRPDHINRKNLDSEVSCGPSVNDSSSLRYVPPHQSLDASGDSNHYHDEAGFSTFGEEHSSLSETMEMHQEEQDLVNMMASSGFHGFNGQFQMPMNMGAPRMPYPISPSVLASMGYSQRNMSGVIPGSVPFVDPHWGTNMQFPHGLVSPNLSHYFSSMGLASNPEEMVDSGSANPELTEVNQEHCDQDFWNEHETGLARDFSDANGHMHPMQYDDMQHPTSVGHNFVSSSRNSSGSSFTRDHHYSRKESRGLVRDDQDDTLHYQNNRENDGQSTERNANLRSLATSHTSSSRSKASSESSWDGSAVKVSKSARDKRGRKAAPSPASPTVFGRGKNGSQYDRLSVDHGSSHADDDIRDWIPLSTMGTELAERSAGPTSAISSHIQSRQYDPAQMRGSESMIPIAPMVLGSGSRQRVMDNSGMVPFAFYPTGPPVPFLTMLPVYNYPTETGNSDGSSSHVDKEESSHRYQSDQISSSEFNDQSQTSVPVKKGAPLEESKFDILNSDFQSHWDNLQYGRLCQNPRHHGPLLYHSPLVVPPMYLQGHFQWDGPGRPLSSNMNVFGQLMGHGHRLLPVAPLQPGSNRPPGGYQHYGDELPRYRGGTGTYLPSTKVSPRDRPSSGNKGYRGNYNYDHLSEREGNWNSKPRYSGRRYSRTQSDKGSYRSDRLTTNDYRANRPWDSYRHDSFPAYHQQNGPLGSTNSTHNGASSGVHGMYPLQAMNSNGMAANGPGIRPVVMLYSYDPSAGMGSTAEQVEFGSLGPMHLSGVNEASQHGEGSPGRSAHEQQRFQGGSGLSSPEQPSSPQFQRLATGQRNYQLKEEDFPPLSFPSHRGNSNGKLSHYQPLMFASNS